MAAIHKRTVFFDVDKDGTHRMLDFARVTTNIGTCLEPFTQICARFVPGTQFADFDPTDEMVRIDAIEGFDLDKEKQLLGDGVHGGYVMPRTGR